MRRGSARKLAETTGLPRGSRAGRDGSRTVTEAPPVCHRQKGHINGPAQHDAAHDVPTRTRQHIGVQSGNGPAGGLRSDSRILGNKAAQVVEAELWHIRLVWRRRFSGSGAVPRQDPEQGAHGRRDVTDIDGMRIYSKPERALVTVAARSCRAPGNTRLSREANPRPNVETSVRNSRSVTGRAGSTGHCPRRRRQTIWCNSRREQATEGQNADRKQ